MKRSRWIPVAFVVASALSGVSSAADPAASLDARTVERAVPGTKVRNVQPVRVEGGLYEVIDESGAVFYIDGATRVGFQCDIFDVATRRNLTQESVARFMAVDFDRLPLDLAIRHVRGDGSRRLAVFADPDCPYCAKLEQELQGVDNITVYTFLYPLADLHPEAVQRSRRIWCAEDREAAWRAWMLEQRDAPPAPVGCDSPVGRIAEAAPAFRVSGTPSLVFSSGRVAYGFIPLATVEQYLGEARLAAPTASAGSGAAGRR